MNGIKKSTSCLLLVSFILNIFFINSVFGDSSKDLVTAGLNKNDININYNPENIIVKFKDNDKGYDLNQFTSKTLIKDSLPAGLVKNVDFLDKTNIGIIKLENSKKEDLEIYIKNLKKLSNVEYAELDYSRKILSYSGVVTNDTNSIEQWYLKSIQADDAWKMYNDTSDKTIVSINDTGINYNHPDLNLNLKDLSSDCYSDTGSLISGGCTNYGWNFEGSGSYNSTGSIFPENEIYDINGHGTHVAGIVGAVGNNSIGTIGVTQNVNLIGARVDTYENDYNFFYVSNTIRALNFAIENGAKIVNASYGGTSYSQAEYDSINIAKSSGLLLVIAAGNNASDNDLTTHFYPSDYDLDNIISVASIGNTDNLAYYSNYGNTSVDLAAPGGDLGIDSGILSTFPFSETIWSHDMNSFSGITLSGTGLAWNIIGNDVIETQSGAYLWDISYTGSEDKTLLFDQTFDLSGAKFAKFEGHIECDLQSGDNLELLINNQVIGVAYPYWDYLRWYYLGNLEIPIPSNLYSPGSELKLRFTSDGDTNYGYGCGFDDFKITKYTDSNHTYEALQGTSMAAPVVTGVASMLWSYKTDLTYSEVKDIILISTDTLISLSGKVLSSGKINAKKAIKELISRYGITKSGSFENEIFNIPNINLNGKILNLSGSTLNITGTGNILNMSGSTITGTGMIVIGTGKTLINGLNTFFSTSSDFDILLKNQSGSLLSSGSTLNGEVFIVSYTGSITGTGEYIKITSGITDLYDGILSQDLLINIGESFSGSIDSYVYKNGDISNGISTGVTLEILNKEVIGNFNFNYVPSSFTGNLNFNDTITNTNLNTINLSSSFYPVNYSISGDLIQTYTGTLTGSSSISVGLNPGDGIKNISGFLENIAGYFSPIFTGSINLDQTSPNVSISANTGTGVAAQSIEFSISSLDMDFNTGSILWSNNLNSNTGTGEIYIVSGETSNSLNVTATYSDLVGNTGSLTSQDYIIDNSLPTGSIISLSGSLANDNFVSFHLVGSEYPISYEMSGSLAQIYTGTLFNSGSLLVELSSGDGNKDVNILYKDISNNSSPIYTSSLVLDKTSPLLTINSHTNNQYISTGSIALTGSLSDLSGITDFFIDGSSVSLNNGDWSKNIDLNSGLNIISFSGSDIAGNTFASNINLIRVPLVSNFSETYLGTGSLSINFNTDLSSTGVVIYGTSPINLTDTGTGTLGLNHNTILTGLIQDQTYYYKTKGIIAGYDGEYSSTGSFVVSLDNTPNAFSFFNVASTELNTDYISNQITVSGTNSGSIVSIIGGYYRINGGSWTNSGSLINNGDILDIKLTSSTIYSTVSSSILTIGTVTETFTITTKSQVVSSGGGGGGGGGSIISVGQTIKESEKTSKSNSGSITDSEIENIMSINKQNKNVSIGNKIVEKIYKRYVPKLEEYDNKLEKISYLGNDISKILNEYRNLIESISKLDQYLNEGNKDLIISENNNVIEINKKLENYIKNHEIKSYNILDNEIKSYLIYENKTIDKIQNLMFKKIDKININSNTFDTFNKFIYSLDYLVKNNKNLSKEEKQLEVKKIIFLYKIFNENYSNSSKKIINIRIQTVDKNTEIQKIESSSNTSNVVNVEQSTEKKSSKEEESVIYEFPFISINLKGDIYFKTNIAVLAKGDKFKLIEIIDNNGLLKVEIIESKIQNDIGKVGYIYRKYLKEIVK